MAPVAEDLERPKGTDLIRPLVPVCVLVAIMWVEEIVDTGLGGDLDQYGIVPRRDFYARAQEAYAVVHTLDEGPYGCFILHKGVIFNA